MQFDLPIRAFHAGVAELIVDETSSLVLNGVEVKRGKRPCLSRQQGRCGRDVRW